MPKIVLIFIIIFSNVLNNLVTTNSLQSNSVVGVESDVKVLWNVTCRHNENVDNRKCQANYCARYVVDGEFSASEVKNLLLIADKGMAQREDVGGPTILDINTGYLRDSNGLENLFYRQQDLFSPAEFQHYGDMILRLKNILEVTFGIEDLYFTAPTFM